MTRLFCFITIFYSTTVEKGEKTADKHIVNPVKAIRAKCLDCSGGGLSEIALCPVVDCALHTFRLGKNPFRKKRELTDAQREQAVQRLKEARALKNAA